MPQHPSRWLPLGVFVGFFVVHLLLLLGTFDAYDLEETEYGNVAVALLDGHLDDYASLQTDPSHGDNLSGGAGRRRRTVFSAEVLVTPVFAVLGASMLSLKLFTLLGGALWALCWFGVARRAAPRAPPWLAAALFVLPMPLIQRQALSATNLFAHLGTSLFLGACLYLLWGRVLTIDDRPETDGRKADPPGSGTDDCRSRGGDRQSSVPDPIAGIAGLIAGFGVYQSASLLPLLLGPLYLAWNRRGVGGLIAFVAGMLPGIAVLLAFNTRPGEGDLAAALTGLTGGDPMRGDPLPVLLENARVALQYGAGFGRVDPDTLRLSFLPWGTAYSVLAALVLASGLPFRGTRSERPLLLAILLSTAGYGAAWARTGFQLETTYFDGLRYLLPICATLPVLLLVALQERPKLAKPAGVLLLAAHLVGLAVLFRPAAFPAPWHRLVGYEPTVMKQWLQGDVDAARVHPDRQARWLRFAGSSAARQAESVATWSDVAPLSARGHDVEAFWRGVGLGMLLRLQAEPPLVLPADTPEPQRGWIAQGMAMGTAYQGCQDALRDRLLDESGADADDLYYGFGRVDLYCEGYFDTQLAPADRASWERGLKDGWRLDYGRDEDASVDFLRRLYVY